MATSRRRQESLNIWPGFVDALAALLMVFMFLLLVFVLSEFYLRESLSGRDEALKRLSTQVSELADLLALERQANADLRVDIAQVSSELQNSLAAKDALKADLRRTTARAGAAEADMERAKTELERLRRDISVLRDVRTRLEGEVGRLTTTLRQSEEQAVGLKKELTAARDRSKELTARLSTEVERTHLAQQEIEKSKVQLKATSEALSENEKLSAQQRTQIEVLNQQLFALRQQLASISKMLDVTEAKNKEQKVQIANLGKRLNVALAGKVQELARYRSEFFGRLRKILGNRDDIRIVGDRFVFQSEVLFNTGSAALGEPGREQLARLATTFKKIAAKIPPDINWILRIDGHTDSRPINTEKFPSNWELSTARAISVVRFLVAQGIPPDRLAATGFGQFQPLVPGNDEAAWRLNRRIEIKLTQR